MRIIPYSLISKIIYTYFYMDENRYCYKYPRPAVTTDCVILAFDGGELKVLLVKRGNEPFKGLWALPGGFLEEHETAEEGAMRELKEETGLDEVHAVQLHAYSAPDRDPRERVVTIAFVALVRLREVKGSDDAVDARWFPVADHPDLGFDHASILHDALIKLREHIDFHPVGSGLLPADMTMGEMKAIRAAIPQLPV